MTSNRSEDFNRFAVLGLVVKPGGYFAIVQTPVSYTHLTLPTNREV